MFKSFSDAVQRKLEDLYVTTTIMYQLSRRLLTPVFIHFKKRIFWDFVVK
jgi:hypothetical protein